MTKTQKIVGTSIGGIILIGLAIFIAIYLTHQAQQKETNLQNQTVATPEGKDIFLGRWEMKFVGNKPEYNYVKHVGFVKTEKGLLMREYLPNAKGEFEIYSFGQWDVAERYGVTYLQTFFWNRDNNDTPSHEFIISSTTPNLITLVETNSFGEAPRTIYLTRLKSSEEEAQVNFALSKEQTAEACQKISNGDSLEPSLILPITCNLSLSINGGEYSFSIDEVGTLSIQQGNQTVFTLPESEERISFADYSKGPFYRNATLQFKDFTFDGWKDMAIQTSAGAYNYFYEYYVFNPQTKKFTKILSDMVNPSFDPASRTLVSFAKGRGLGDIYVTSTYKFINGSYVLVKVESQDIEGEDLSFESKHRHIIRELVNGVWATTTDEIVELDMR